MSKRKQLINYVFERIKETSEKDTKNGWSDDLADAIYKKLKFKISGKTLCRYYEAYIDGTNEEKGIETLILNRLSQYLGFNDYEDFCTTIEKKGEDASKTKIKVDVDNNPFVSTNAATGVKIYISNNNDNKNDNKNDQHFKMPEFIKQNGLGVLEMTFVLFLVTGGVVFSNNKNSRLGIMSSWGSPAVDKPYMYWDKDRYMATDSSSLGSQVEVIPMNEYIFKNLKKITRPDTLTTSNAMGKVWYNKSNNHVEFFTSFGKHPENEKSLKDVTEYMLTTYAGANAELE
jgi:hypothetical protein